MIHCQLLNGQHFGITNEMEGKMEGMHSLNTSAEINPFCQAMRQCPGSVCHSCYSKSRERRWHYAHEAWVNNYYVLSENVLKDRELPIINNQLFRFDAHGDLVNRVHYKNQASIAEANPKTMFTLWSKNLAIINRGGIIKLHNLIHVFSTYKLNELNPILPKGFDKVFTVFRRPFVRENNVEINCEKKCITCGKCYERNNIVKINELIKGNK